MPDTARVFFEIGERLGIDDLAEKGAGIATADAYERQAVDRALSQLAEAQVSFTRAAHRAGGSEAWLAAQGDRLARVQRTLAEVGGETLTLARLMVAVGALNDLAADTR